MSGRSNKIENILSIDVRETGRNIKRLADERGVSARMISRRLAGISEQAVYKWLSGKCLPSLENMIALRRILELDSVEDLLVVKIFEPLEDDMEDLPVTNNTD